MFKQCVSPPELDDRQLLLYLEGEADKDILSHLDRCEYCRDKAQSLARFQNRLTSRLYRITCPSSLDLGQYHLHILPASQMLLIRQHVQECPHCAREIAQLEAFFLDDLAPMEDDPFAQAKALVARLVNGTPTASALRGEADEPFIYQAGKARIVIEVQDDVEQMGLKSLLGLVTGLETNEFTIEVSQGDQVIANTSIDEIGNFIISHLTPGHYQLILNSPNMEISIPSLPVL